MRKLFPEASAVPLGFSIFGSSLVAHYRQAEFGIQMLWQGAVIREFEKSTALP